MADDLLDEYVLGRCPVERLPELATELLLAGRDTDEMAAAALPDTRDHGEIRRMFEVALASVGEQLPPWNVAAERFLARRARAVIDGEATLDDVAREIRNNLGWPSKADGLPAPFRRVLIAADEDLEPWWREEFRDALVALLDATS